MPEEHKNIKDKIEKEIQEEIQQWWSNLSSDEQAKYKADGLNTPEKAFDSWLENWSEHRGKSAE